jgi:hypothetical protein
MHRSNAAQELGYIIAYFLADNLVLQFPPSYSGGALMRKAASRCDYSGTRERGGGAFRSLTQLH